MKVLFLDDKISRIDRFLHSCPCAVVARTADAAKKALLLFRPWNLIFLDCDLNEEFMVPSEDVPSNNGMEVAEFMVDNHDMLKTAHVVIHSTNSGMALHMMSVLEEAEYAVSLSPFKECGWVKFL